MISGIVTWGLSPKERFKPNLLNISNSIILFKESLSTSLKGEIPYFTANEAKFGLSIKSSITLAVGVPGIFGANPSTIPSKYKPRKVLSKEP